MIRCIVSTIVTDQLDPRFTADGTCNGGVMLDGHQQPAAMLVGWRMADGGWRQVDVRPVAHRLTGAWSGWARGTCVTT